MKKFTIECEMPDRWVQPFISMLKTMEIDGKVGHSETVGMYADGDGDFQSKFVFKGVDVEKWSPPLPDDYPHVCIFDADWEAEDIHEWLEMYENDEIEHDEEDIKHLKRLIADGWGEDKEMKI